MATFDEQRVMEQGAFLAAGISTAWLVGAVVLALALSAIGSSFVLIPVLVGIGAVAAMPVSFVLGWKLAMRAVRSRKAFWPMVGLTVLLTDIEIALVAGLGAVVLTGNLGGLLYTAIGIPYGLALYGLPGLAMAIPSAWFWEHRMRQTFNRSPDATPAE